MTAIATVLTRAELEQRIHNLEALNVSLSHDLERVCGERDAARMELEIRVKLRQELHEALEAWSVALEGMNLPQAVTVDAILELNRLSTVAMTAYRAARDGDATWTA